MDKPFRRYKGVGIFRNREVLLGSDFRVAKDGTLWPTKPQYEVTYSWPGGYPYGSLDEAKAAVDSVLGRACELGIELEEMVKELNENSV